MNIKSSLVNALLKAVYALDPALERTREERQLEKAVQLVAKEHNLQYVPATPMKGIPADVVFNVGGLPICGLSKGPNNHIPTGVLARVVEPKVLELTRGINWEFSCGR